ncbi:nonsense-mediated mRNA decay factor SMG8 [Plodia interpunctella]|uniref:nonsense-mediated mRNA decay factor SMG8 n=1 Tax=Plodia interpunctella TaxID=58824 RepID=UPI002367B103|nr:nonsense-mediated mRNA decay factor SMG8 [Plodia interpunctella]XP_053605965.1 nonsense-mediated mRNA decay factor SMG8 [Plodia interpunctella]
MKTFPIEDIPEFSKKERIVVVGVIGKSPYRYSNKTTPLLPSAKSDENNIECFWDERQGVLYLHAVTYLDTKQLTKLAATLDENSKTTIKDADAAHWLVASGELASESCRAMALLFHLCHIVVLSSPTPVFDLGYLQLFKAIDAYRTELLPRTSTALCEVAPGSAWESHGRCSCPRLLFHFRRAPAPLRAAPASLKRLEHAVEDQLYFILRKARIITNVCAKSLFAIPKNEEFVYMSAEENSNHARDVSSLVRGLVERCSGDVTTAQPSQRPTFKQFLQAHVDLAFSEGFDDNVGKYAMSTSFFELPSASSWRNAAQALAPIYLSASAEDQSEAGALYDALATDVRFSQARCAKVLPIAQASYAEGLPSHYSSQHHAHKVSVALGVLESMARGPLAAGARARLAAACRAVWGARSLCEAPSLTHHVCMLPHHDNSKEHSSGVRYIAACNCGRSKSSREDPYSVRSANHTFYTQAAEECGTCPTLQTIEFPVFQPSTPTYRAASLKDSSSQEAAPGGRASASLSGEAAPDAGPAAGGWSEPDALSPGEARDEDDDDNTPEDKYVVPVRGDAASEKVITRQPSTTEYLPGMLHLGSPSGLLPAFPSWSLVCLGASSLYSHSVGLPEHLQPGFLPHSNYLLPWDCAVRLEQAGLWRSAPSRSRKPAPHLTVKIFIGFEYECPRGHRFMMSSPDSMVSGSGATGGGARLANTDMPLFASCVCRVAQLTRLHVVTPKASVHVMLDPKVQPVPGGPTFVPQPAGSAPIKLSPSAYWVLRLPYMYADERGPLPRPRPTTLHTGGTLIAPVFGLQD